MKRPGITLRRIRESVLFLLTAICFILTVPGPTALASEKDRIKALYLYNFLLFVDWPEEAVDEGGKICVAVTGDERLFECLKPLAGKTLRGRRMVLKRLEEMTGLKQPCHALFIGRSKRMSVSQILDKIKGEPVLAMSDMSGFAKMGGMVFFKNIGERKDETGYPNRFEINLTAVQREGLKIRARLLRMSDIIY